MENSDYYNEDLILEHGIDNRYHNSFTAILQYSFCVDDNFVYGWIVVNLSLVY